jgi:hypothetical protein
MSNNNTEEQEASKANSSISNIDEAVKEPKLESSEKIIVDKNAEGFTVKAVENDDDLKHDFNPIININPDDGRIHISMTREELFQELPKYRSAQEQKEAEQIIDYINKLEEELENQKKINKIQNELMKDIIKWK